MASNRKTFKHLTSRLLDDQGQDLVEYALIVALLAFATVAGSGTVSSSIQSAINGLATAVSNNT
jgi:pilus assembly protein Flp/PilA